MCSFNPTAVRYRPWSAAGLGVGLMFLCGCVGPITTRQVPAPLVAHAKIPGYDGIRYGYDHTEMEFVADYQTAMGAAQPGDDGVAVLALSGGGANGAFCAGILCGWTDIGRRPNFQVVTGVSTGALAAPFAFLGPAYDDRLIGAYTTISDRDIFLPHFVSSAFNLFRGDSLADTKPLTQTLSRFVDQKMLDDIAAEYRRGRRLYVCTTELASGRAVFWNLTAVAASGRPDALPLFIKILTASASIPIVFPPQYFEVEAGQRRYTEMHVDGGLSRQVFIHMHGARAGLAPKPDGKPVPLTAYIICNTKITPEYEPIRPSLLPIALRTVNALLRAEAIGDLHRIYIQTTTEQAGFRLAAIPEDFSMQHQGTFDPKFMKDLFNLGRQLAQSGQLWRDQPPTMGVSR